jgi:2-amino-4-hydroxy-6-hydroxymethyldihydropteridine diphosphokinase
MRMAYLAMGANVPGPAGTPAATLAAAAARLESIGRVLRRSSLYSTPPVGFAEQPRFLNAAVALQTGLSPHSLLEALLDIEHEYGRDRSTSVPNGPRSLDLDILMFGDLCLSESDLEIPHPRMAERAFVLVPLNEIAPQIVAPRYRATVAQLLARLRVDKPGGPDEIAPIHDEHWRMVASGPDATGDAAGPEPLRGAGRSHGDG